MESVPRAGLGSVVASCFCALALAVPAACTNSKPHVSYTVENRVAVDGVAGIAGFEEGKIVCFDADSGNVCGIVNLVLTNRDVEGGRTMIRLRPSAEGLVEEGDTAMPSSRPAYWSPLTGKNYIDSEDAAADEKEARASQDQRRTLEQRVEQHMPAMLAALAAVTTDRAEQTCLLSAIAPTGLPPRPSWCIEVLLYQNCLGLISRPIGNGQTLGETMDLSPDAIRGTLKTLLVDKLEGNVEGFAPALQRKC